MKAALVAVVVLIIAITVSVSWPGAATAQSGVNVLDLGVENQFPDGLRFHIEVESSSPIEEIRVYVRKLGQSSRSTYRTVEFEPGNRIAGEALFQSKTSNEYIPTGTRLSYYFDIRTVDGERFETEPEILVYLNRGLNWDSVSDGLINVYYYHHSDRSEERAEKVLEVAAQTYDQMGPILGVDLTEPLNLVVYSDYRDMRAALRTSSRVAQQQLRTLGQAFANERTLLVDGSNDSFIGDNILTTAAHEFTHLLVADAAGSAYGQVHTWLNEGLAVYSEGADTTEYDLWVNTAIRNDAVPPLASLRTYAGTPQETLRNYGLGHSAVTYMLDAYGNEKMAALFAELRTTHNLETALEAIYGIDIVDLDNDWRQSLGLEARAMSTPALPAFQTIPTRRPTATPTQAPLQAQASTPVAPSPATSTPTQQPRPTYTPAPVPTQSAPSPPAPTSGGCAAPPAEANGKGVPMELASAALLAGPLGLLGLAAVRRRWRGKTIVVTVRL